MLEDKGLKCRDCGADFVFTAQEQEFYAEKGFQNEPSRCPACRSARRRTSSTGAVRSNSAGTGARTLFRVRCSSCGSEAEVPFRPTEGRAVYCSGCYQKSRRAYSY